MNRFFYIIIILISFFISSCRINTNKDEKTFLIIEEFNLNRYSENGGKLYMVKTPYSVFNQNDQSYLLNETNIKFFDKENVKYNINSDSAELLNNKFLKLNGNVEMNDFKSDKTVIKSNNLFWYIDKTEFILEGNVSLVNKTINLKSSKALFDRKKDIITFYNPIEYNYNDEDGIRKYNISSENAYYNVLTKDVIFESKKDRVKSKIVF
tara:strand:+ start:210 stop:836 length:627 start_codon:yes stop_codon:yes gene_type:complete